MMSKEELKALIPYGMYGEVALSAGVSIAAVSKFFSNKTKESYRIEKAAMEVAIAVQGEKATLQKQLKKLTAA